MLRLSSAQVLDLRLLLLSGQVARSRRAETANFRQYSDFMKRVGLDMLLQEHSELLDQRFTFRL